MAYKNKKGETLPGKKGLCLTEPQIRYAMSNSSSNGEAARWLHVSYCAWRKYASLYIDKETELNLYQLHKLTRKAPKPKAPRGRRPGCKSNWPNKFVAKPMSEILDNKYPTYMLSRFRERLVEEGYKEECCDACGFREYRPYDYSIPLRMHWVDGNPRNYNLSNIQFLCYNCYYVNVGNFGAGTTKRYYFDLETGEPVPILSAHSQKHYDMKKMGYKEYRIPVDPRNHL